MEKVIVFGLADSVGGVENYLLSIQQKLADKVRFIFFLEMKNNMHVSRIRQFGGEVVHVPREDGLTAYIRKLKAELKAKRNETETVYLNISNFSHERLLVMMIARHLGFRVIVHCHAAQLGLINGLAHKMMHR